jgi:hypothetical protein
MTPTVRNAVLSWIPPRLFLAFDLDQKTREFARPPFHRFPVTFPARPNRCNWCSQDSMAVNDAFRGCGPQLGLLTDILEDDCETSQFGDDATR